MFIKANHYTATSPSEKIEGISHLINLESREGYVFLLAYTKKSNADAELLLQGLSDHIHRLAESFGKQANAQHRFEQFLGALNEYLATQILEGKWSIPIEEFHAVVGIAVDSRVYLSGTGELTALFLHKKPSSKYQIFNLFRSIQTEQALPSWEKAFAVILDGDLHGGDVFCASNQDLQRTIPQEDLHSLLSTLPPLGSIEQIRQYFGPKESMLLLVIKAQKERDTSDINSQAKHLSDVSIDHLNETTDRTSKYLDDQRPQFFSNAFKKIKGSIQESAGKFSNRFSQQFKGKNLAKKLLAFSVHLAKKRVVKSVKHLAKKSKNVLKKSTNESVLKKPNPLNKLVNALKKSDDSKQRLPKSTIYLIVGVIIAIIVLAIGISFISKSRAANERQTEYEQQVSDVEVAIERAAGAVIYKDEEQARKLYIQASQLIQALPQENQEQVGQIQEFQSQIQSALDEIRHLITIPNPPLLGDLADIKDGVFGNGMTIIDGTIFVHSSDGRTYVHDKSAKRFGASTDIGITPASSVVTSDDQLIYTLTDEGVYQINTENLSSKQTPITSEESWTDLFAFANRIYALREKTGDQEGQVLRINISGDTFSDPSDWITSKTQDLSNATSLTIDGTIYVLKANGSVLRYESGSEIGWDIGVVEPPFQDAQKIWTEATSDYVYILEPSTRRLVVYEKENGAFLVQYTSDAFNDLTDFLVDETNRSIYLLAGSKLYTISASHIPQ